MKVYSVFICLFAIQLFSTCFAGWQTTVIEKIDDFIKINEAEGKSPPTRGLENTRIKFQLIYIENLTEYIMKNFKPEDIAFVALLTRTMTEIREARNILKEKVDEASEKQKEKDLNKDFKTLLVHFKEMLKSIKSEIDGFEEFAKVEGGKMQRSFDLTHFLVNAVINDKLEKPGQSVLDAAQHLKDIFKNRH